MWRIITGLVVLIVVISIAGLVLKALRWLLIVALVLALVAGGLGAVGRRGPR